MKIRDMLSESILMNYRLSVVTSERAVDKFEKWLDTEVPEPKGVKPCREYVTEYEHYYSCGSCEDSVETEHIFCPNCGTKIKWEGRDET